MSGNTHLAINNVLFFFLYDVLFKTHIDNFTDIYLAAGYEQRQRMEQY